LVSLNPGECRKHDFKKGNGQGKKEKREVLRIRRQGKGEL